MNKQKNLTGWLLISAAFTFWTSWFLMPDPGTTDTQYILKAVKEERINVLCSVIMQIVSSVLYILALFLLAQLDPGKKRTALVGISLFGIGAMGLCADAFFHLLAYFMTEGSVNIQQDVIHVMEFMQTTGVTFLIPLLIPLFIGSLVVSIGLEKKVLFAKTSTILFMTAFAVAITGGVSTNAFHYTIPGLSIITLALFACGQVLMGIGIIKLSGNMLQHATGKRKHRVLGNTIY
jgi:hypothetical protein